MLSLEAAWKKIERLSEKIRWIDRWARNYWSDLLSTPATKEKERWLWEADAAHKLFQPSLSRVTIITMELKAIRRRTVPSWVFLRYRNSTLLWWNPLSSSGNHSRKWLVVTFKSFGSTWYYQSSLWRGVRSITDDCSLTIQWSPMPVLESLHQKVLSLHSSTGEEVMIDNILWRLCHSSC